ncbi:MAG: PQQ-dependent sugar dehydrogenase [Pirellulaceae bacterium]
MLARLTPLTISIAFLTTPLFAQKVDESPAPVKVVRAFPNLKITRPTVFTTAQDGTNRLFVVTQQGKINVFSNDQKVSEAKTFLDISDRVVYKEKENEEGFLGLAFHPKFKENGQFFVYYTSTVEPQLSVIARFRVNKNHPDQADPASEEELLRIKQPYWNHNGGSIVFGPDGFLYIGMGDGGAANDPHGNGQKMSTLLGKILRIDVDHHEQGKAYAIPKDNPFVGKAAKAGALPEIWASGLRNPWCISFDKKDGTLWCADVGQDIWEEIDIIVKGGNYGWNLREGFHKFGPMGSEPRKDLIEPIWEYKHDVGKSITGGEVYHGKRVPELEGHYIYADYVSGKVWALQYDAKSGKTIANRSLQTESTMPYIAIGQDDSGEVYLTDSFGQIWWLEKK